MLKLLLVEDDNNLREIYEARLQAEGYNIVSAKDGEEALAVAKAEKPDLIISDVMMPKISGFEMLDILRNTEGLKSVKVIMLTALGQTDDQQRADKLGADRYLIKSQVTLEDIVRVTHELLEDQDAGPANSKDPAPSPSAEALPTATATSSASANAPDKVATEPTTPAPEPVDEPANDTTAKSDDSNPAPTDSTTTTPPNASIPVVDEPTEATAQAQTESEEAAKVETEIENFVAGANSDPATSVAATPADNNSVDSASSSSAATDEPEEATATGTEDDKIMADAVNTLMSDGDGDKPAAKDSPDESAQSNDAVQSTRHKAAPETSSDVDAPSTTEAASDNVTIAHKKIIAPLGDGDKPKPDIQTLYAEEQAKEAAKTDDTQQTTEEKASSEPATENSPKTDTPTDDPNSIAL